MQRVARSVGVNHATVTLVVNFARSSTPLAVRVDVGLGLGLGQSNMATAKPAPGPLYGRDVACLRITSLHMDFSATPTLILNLSISYESHAFVEFHATFCVGKYCQLFTHESIIDQ